MPTTIFKAFPGGTSGTTSGSLYAELKRPGSGTSRAALTFQKFSGPYITSAMSIKKVTFEFRAGFSGSNAGTFTFQTSGGTTVAEIKDIDNNTGKNLYYRADYEFYPNDKNILPPWEGLVNSNLSSLLASNFTLYFCCLDAEYNTAASTIWKYNSDASGYNTNEWKCTVEWEYKPTSATLPTSLGTSSSTSSLVTSYSGYGTKTLYWSGATGGQNASGVSLSPSGYEISGGHLGSSVYSTNSTQYTFRFPENLNETYIYYLKTISKNGEEYNSESLPIILTTYYSNPGTPTNIRINNVTNAYIGIEGNPTMKLTWDTPSSSGSNNSIASYTIYLDNKAIKYGITQTSYQLETLTTGSYTVQAIGSIPNTTSSISNAATLNYISEPSAPLDNNINIASIDSPTLSWNAAKKNNGVKSINYFIYEEETLIYSGEDTSFYYDYDEYFKNDKSTANLTIFTRAYAVDGGYTQSSSKTIIVAKISNFSIPLGFWNSIPTLFYSSATVSWNKINELDPNLEDRSPFKYELFFRSSSTGSWSNKGDVSGKTEFVLDTTIPEGNTIGYYMLITDKYGLSTTSEIIEATKIIRPSIRNLQAATNGQTFTSAFTLQSNLAETAVQYEIYLHFPEGDTKTEKSEGSLTGVLKEDYFITGSSIESLHKVDLSTLQEKLTIDSKCYNDLYTKIITNCYSKPTVSYIVKAWYEDFEDAITEIESSSFQIDYAVDPATRGIIAVLDAYKKNVYNPEDIIQLYVSGFKLKENDKPLEGATAQKIEHKLISNYSKKSYSENADITIPSVSTDTNIGFYHVTTITYADTIKTYTNNVSCTIQVARWVKENIILESIAKSNTNEYTGYIILPEQLCSSLTLSNLHEIILSATIDSETIGASQISFYLDGYSTNIVDWQVFGSTLIGEKIRKIKFVLNHTSTSYDLSISIKWVNTSGKSFDTQTVTFSYHEAAADFAIRKQRAGINVGDNFVGASEKLNNSAATFEINHGTGMGNRPIVSITGNNVTGYIKAGTEKLILEGFDLGDAYTLPIASSSTLGGIKVGSGLNIDSNGVLSASAQNYNLPIATSSILGGVTIGPNINVNNGEISITKDNVVAALGYTPTNTTYDAGSGITLNGTTFSHSDTSSVSNLTESSRRYITGLTFDDYGHVTDYTYATETVTNTTYSNGTGLALNGTTFSLKTASDTVLGGVKIGSGLSISNGVVSVSRTILYSPTQPASGKEGDIWLMPIE